MLPATALKPGSNRIELEAFKCNGPLAEVTVAVEVRSVGRFCEAPIRSTAFGGIT
ncbi:hypothetical protein D3C85_1605950 [compost metagenome]